MYVSSIRDMFLKAKMAVVSDEANRTPSSAENQEKKWKTYTDECS